MINALLTGKPEDSIERLPAYDEQYLLEQISRGDELSFRRIFDKYHQKIYLLCFFFTRSHSLAEDITQEVFIKVWIKRDGLPGINSFEKWLKILVRNHAYNCLKRMSIEQRLLKIEYLKTKPLTTLTENILADKELNNLLKKTIDKLPPRQKNIYMLSRQDGLKLEEIARLMNININTVKNHLKAALYTLRITLIPHLTGIILV